MLVGTPAADKQAVLQMLYKWKPPDRNPFIGFDSAFKQVFNSAVDHAVILFERRNRHSLTGLPCVQGPYKKAEPEKNVFSDFEQGYKAPRFHQLKQDHSPLEKDMPKNYPFNEEAVSEIPGYVFPQVVFVIINGG